MPRKGVLFGTASDQVSKTFVTRWTRTDLFVLVFEDGWGVGLAANTLPAVSAEMEFASGLCSRGAATWHR